MTEKKIPEKWQASAKAIKAVQVAFDLDEKFQYAIRKQALDQGLSPSEQIREILGLPLSKRPKRPRLTVSLNKDDYAYLGEKFGLDASDELQIKKRVMDALIEFVDSQQK